MRSLFTVISTIDPAAMLALSSGITQTMASFLGLVLTGAGLIAVPILFNELVIKKTPLGKINDFMKNNKAAQAATKWAKDRADESRFNQRRQMARDFRKSERRRAAANDFAERVRTSAAWRRRAAGRFNAAGQQRAYVHGVGAQKRLEEEEVSQANLVLQEMDVQSMPELTNIALGGRGSGRSGQVVDGEGNPALMRAAMRRIIKAQDADGMERILLQGTREQQLMFRNEVETDYSTAKGAGAHFVDRDVLAAAGQAGRPEGRMSRQELDEASARSAAKLAAAKLAAQDGPSATAAAFGYLYGPALGADAEDQLVTNAVLLLSTPESLKDAKPGVRQALEQIVAHADTTGSLARVKLKVDPTLPTAFTVPPGIVPPPNPTATGGRWR